MPGPEAAARVVAITIDDLPAVSTRRDVGTWTAITDGVLDALEAHGAHATGFVNEGKLGRMEASTRLASRC